MSTIAVADATRTRTAHDGRYIVPATSHWAEWHDADAIRHHGIRLPTDVPVAAVRRELGDRTWTDAAEAHADVRAIVTAMAHHEPVEAIVRGLMTIDDAVLMGWSRETIQDEVDAARATRP